MTFSQDQTAPPVVPQLEEQIMPAAEPAAAALSTTPVRDAPMHIIIESQPPAERSVNREQPPPATVTRAPRPTVRRNNLAIGTLQAPVLKKNTPATGSSEAPIVVADASNGLDQVAQSNALLADAGTGPAAPPPPISRPSVGGQLQPPQLISSPQPAYPAAARAQRVQGVVALDVLVDETGKVVETTVIVGHPLLQAAAKDALRNWRYQPARLNGEPIPMHIKVNLRFNLN
jgi:protein TonB